MGNKTGTLIGTALLLLIMASLFLAYTPVKGVVALFAGAAVAGVAYMHTHQKNKRKKWWAERVQECEKQIKSHQGNTLTEPLRS